MYHFELYAELERRKDQVAELNHEYEASALLGEPVGGGLLYALGRQLSSAGDRLQARYGSEAKRPRVHISEVSYRFN